MTVRRFGCRRRQAERLRSCRAERCCARSMSPRMPEPPSTAAPVSARRGSHPEDRSEERLLADPGAGRRRGFEACVGRRLALGGAVSGPQDPSSRPPNGKFFAPSSPTASSPGSWVDGDLARTWEGDEAIEAKIDPQTGKVLEASKCGGVGVSGLESDGGDQVLYGGGNSGKVRTVPAQTLSAGVFERGAEVTATMPRQSHSTGPTFAAQAQAEAARFSARFLLEFGDKQNVRRALQPGERDLHAVWHPADRRRPTAWTTATA